MALGREGLGQAVLELVTDPTKLRAGLAAARQETTQTLSSANQALNGIGKQMTSTGGQMTRGVTVPVIAAGAAIVAVGGEFEHTLSQIVGLVGVSREQVTAWKPEIEALAEATGIGPNELAKGLYFVASSGIDASKAMGVLTIAAKASEAGMGDVEMLADVLTGTMNAYAKSNLTAAHAMDVLVRGIQVGKAEPADFAAALGTVAPVAAQLGVTVEDLVGTMAILSRTNSNVAENSTSLGQIFNTLLKPTDATAKALAKMGLSAAELRQELADKGTLAVLKTLGEHIGTDDEAIAQIFPNIRALRGVLNLTGQDALSVSTAMAKVADSSGALDDAVKAVADDAQTKLNQALAKMQVQLILLSSDVLPLVVTMFNQVVTWVQGAVEWFTALPGPVKAVAVQGLALLAILGPILIVLGSIITAGTAVLGAFGTMATFMGGTLVPTFARFLAMLVAGAIDAFATAIFATGIPALEALGVALVGVESMAGPLLLVAGAVIAIGAAASGAGPSVAELKAKIHELENEGGLFGFFDFAKDAKIQKLKDALAEAEAAEAAAAAKEREDLLDRQKAWAEWSSGVKETLGRLGDELGAGKVTHAVGGMIDDIDAGLKSGKYKIKDGALVMADGLPAGVAVKGKEAVKKVQQSIADMAQAIRNGRRAIVTAMTEVIDDAYDPLILAADIAATKTELAEQRKIAASKGYTQAQIDAAHTAAKTDKQREAADKLHTVAEVNEAKHRVLELKKQLATQLADQTQYGTDAERLALLTGQATSKELIAGLQSGDSARRTASQAAAAGLASGIIALMKSTNTYGIRTGNAYVDGLIQAFEDRVRDARRAVGIYRNMFIAFSPPGPESPLHEIDIWGRKTGEAYLDPFIGAIGAGRDRIRIALSALSSLMTPSLAGIASAADAAVTRQMGSLGSLGRGAPSAAGQLPVASLSRQDATDRVVEISIGDIHLHGIGSDVSPAAAGRFADRFKQAVMDSVGEGLRVQARRTGRHASVTP